MAYAGLGVGRNKHDRYSRFFRRRLPLPAGRVPVFGRRRGAIGSCHRARALPDLVAAQAGVRADRAADRGGRAAADRVLRVRIALARPLHRAGLSRLQRRLRGHLAEVGLVRRQGQPGRAQQCVSRHRSAAEPCFHAFSFTVADADAAPSFVIAGSAETREGSGSYSERTIRRGESSPEAVREKARYVFGEMERRLATLGLCWADTTATQVYTVRDLYPFLSEEILPRGPARAPL